MGIIKLYYIALQTAMQNGQTAYIYTSSKMVCIAVVYTDTISV